jgi:3-hydroxymyristoyl/3-hydroxydecanoyl-(acyl carrier protein) dehydratase/malonyl CoA-acyl carrier protein transacylase
VQLVEQSLAMFYSGALTAVLHTKIVQDYFRVQPHSALGYSLGEVSMVLALALNTDVWESAEALVSRAESSPLLKTRISGPKNAVREAWGWPSLDTDEDSDFWGTYVLLSPLDAVKQVLRQENRVYLTHINTPQEVVIAGDKASCHRVIERLQCDAFPIPASTVIHCEPMHSEYGEMVQWLTLPVREQTPLNLYSSAECDRMALDSHSVVHRITKALCQCVDFPQLVHRSYDDGTRIFLELGPGGTCTRWIRENLKGKEHLALFLNRRGANDLVGIVRVLAQLVSHQVAIDLSPLYAPLQEAAAPKKSLIRTVTLGGCRIRSTIVTELTPENRKRFATRLSSVPHERVPVAAARQTASPQQPAVKEVVGAASVRSSGASGGNVGSNTRPQAIDNPSYPQHDMNPDDSRTKAASASETTESAPEVPPLNSYSLHYQKLQANTTRSTQAHASFLDARRESLRQMSEMVGLQIAVLERMLDAPPAQSSPPASQPPKPSGITFTKGSSRNANVVFDEAEVLEMAGGKLSRVFGEDFAIVDSYPKATRVPMPPYLFISRVTKLDAKRGCFEPCSIETEYDIPKDAWYALDGQVSGIIFIEASHGNIFLASYLGVDFNNKGQRVYRALGGSTTFLSDLPDVGETVRCKVSINSFSRSGNTLLFFFTHECYLGDRLFLRMESGAGFFSEKELNKGQGVNLTKREKQERQTIQKQQFTPLLTCSKTAFTEDDILKLSVGNLAACFGTHYEQNGKNPSLRLPSSPLRMIDRVTSVVLKGGAWGLGFLVAEKTLDPEHWYFNCHFKDDYCLPGTLLSEASSQLLTFYMLYLGLPTRTTNARFRPILNLNQTGRYRGQIKPTSATLTYQIEVTSIGLDPVPYATADAFIVFGGKTISIITNVGIQISENQG